MRDCVVEDAVLSYSKAMKWSQRQAGKGAVVL